jgi:hypothetical protein
MKITVEVADQKVDFFMELLKHFENFVSIESVDNLSPSDSNEALLNETNLSKDPKEILNEIFMGDDNLIKRLL